MAPPAKSTGLKRERIANSSFPDLSRKIHLYGQLLKKTDKEIRSFESQLDNSKKLKAYVLQRISDLTTMREEIPLKLQRSGQ